jgi:hypothetical protein
MPPQAQPCRCKPSCTKLLGPQQRKRHRLLLQQALDSSESEHDLTNEIEQILPSVLPQPGTTDVQGHRSTNLEFSDQVFNDDAMEFRDHEAPQPSRRNHQELMSSDESTDSQSDGNESRSHDSNADNEFEDEFEDDRVTDEDLIQALEERFGDDWQNELNGLRESNTGQVKP